MERDLVEEEYLKEGRREREGGREKEGGRKWEREGGEERGIESVGKERGKVRGERRKKECEESKERRN